MRDGDCFFLWIVGQEIGSILARSQQRLISMRRLVVWPQVAQAPALRWLSREVRVMATLQEFLLQYDRY